MEGELVGVYDEANNEILDVELEEQDPKPVPEVTRVKDLMCRFHAACEQAKNREEYLLKYGVYEYVFTRKEEPDVIKGVLIPAPCASQW